MTGFQRWFVWLRLHLTGDRRKRVSLDVEFWLTPDRLWQGMSLGCVPHYVEVFTDALLSGWGGTLGRLTVGRVWESPLAHINALEMVAVQRMLLHFAPSLECEHVMVRSANTMVVA